MRKPKLCIRQDYGHVSWPNDWWDHDALTRADLLQDWLLELTAEYNRTVPKIVGDNHGEVSTSTH